MRIAGYDIHINRTSPTEGASSRPTPSSSRPSMPKFKHPSENLLRTFAVGVGVAAATLVGVATVTVAPILAVPLMMGAYAAFGYSIHNELKDILKPPTSSPAGPPKPENVSAFVGSAKEVLTFAKDQGWHNQDAATKLLTTKLATAINDLEVSPGDRDAAKKVRKFAMLLIHPDKISQALNNTDKTKATELFRCLNENYQKVQGD